MVMLNIYVKRYQMLPFIAFTGTPIETTDKSTTGLFGDIIDVYDMTQAVQMVRL